MGFGSFRSALVGGSFVAAMAMAGPVMAVPIDTTFNFVPTTALVASTGDVSTAATITSGAPDIVTSIISDNTGLISLGTIIGLESPTPVTLGATFTKTFTTLLGVFTETLTVTLVTPGPSSLGILATGTIVETTVLSGAQLDPTPVFYSACACAAVSSGMVRDGGKRAVKRLPKPKVLSMSSVAWWRDSACFTIARPKPVPPVSRERLRSTR